ncbi:hypothetical protein FGIG_11609 [Fasciola gigantica]|uniref:Uncharacterized protein n=1 Tax=Fasciola gigantica TaxID=46835 RepID=A0A504Z0P5_FASGI|nr:hypothetical protein FGIG_11609 [Fasciola gigantica]
MKPPLAVEYTDGNRAERASNSKRIQTTDSRDENNSVDGLTTPVSRMSKTSNGLDSDSKTSKSQHNLDGEPSSEKQRISFDTDAKDDDNTKLTTNRATDFVQVQPKCR